MTYYEIIIYSIIQGTTEFLPISSSAHLIFIKNIFNWPNTGLIYPIAAHLGTLFAVIFNRRVVLLHMYKDTIKNIKAPLKLIKESDFNIIYLLIITLPIIFFGLIFISLYSNYQFNLLTIGIASIFGGLLLESTEHLKIKKNNTLSIKKVIFVGCIQSLAIIPGVSRAGAAITGLRFLGISRIKATEFSLIMGIPVIFISGLYSIIKIYQINDIQIIINTTLIIFISFISALLSIKFLLHWLKRNSFRIFILYRIILGFILITLYYM